MTFLLPAHLLLHWPHLQLTTLKMMFSKTFKGLRDTWESDMRVGVVEQERMEGDIFEVVKTRKLTFTFNQDQCCKVPSGLCVPGTNKLVLTVGIISEDSCRPGSDLGIPSSEQIVIGNKITVDAESPQPPEFLLFSRILEIC